MEEYSKMGVGIAIQEDVMISGEASPNRLMFNRITTIALPCPVRLPPWRAKGR